MGFFYFSKKFFLEPDNLSPVFFISYPLLWTSVAQLTLDYYVQQPQKAQLSLIFRDSPSPSLMSCFAVKYNQQGGQPLANIIQSRVRTKDGWVSKR